MGFYVVLNKEADRILSHLSPKIVTLIVTSPKESKKIYLEARCSQGVVNFFLKI